MMGCLSPGPPCFFTAVTVWDACDVTVLRRSENNKQNIARIFHSLLQRASRRGKEARGQCAEAREARAQWVGGRGDPGAAFISEFVLGYMWGWGVSSGGGRGRSGESARISMTRIGRIFGGDWARSKILQKSPNPLICLQGLELPSQKSVS